VSRARGFHIKFKKIRSVTTVKGKFAINKAFLGFKPKLFFEITANDVIY